MVYLRHLYHHSSWVGRLGELINALIAAAISAVCLMFVLSIVTLSFLDALVVLASIIKSLVLVGHKENKLHM